MIDSSEAPPTVNEAPPTVNEALAKIFKSWYIRRHSSAHVPTEIYDAVTWWIDFQEPADEDKDRPQKMTNKKGTISWITPYHDRVSYNLRMFLGMSEFQKAFIIDRIRAGIPYRGDDFEFYKMVVKQAEIMVKDPDNYIGHASEILEAFKHDGLAKQDVVE